MKFSSIEDVYRYLEEIPTFQEVGKRAADFDLERFSRFCSALGNPQDTFPSIHVAGTNGKGSTCQILASVYQEGGYSTGLYTSPHLLEFRERFRINGNMITDEELLNFFQAHEGVLKSFRITYFELSTAIAFWWFAHRGADIALIETGLGGRLDATNVIEPELCIITNISLDHTDVLGDTLEKIATEKAGIIKKGVPVVLGNIAEDCRKVIEAIARRRNSTVYTLNELEPKWNEGTCILNQGDKGLISLDTDFRHSVQAFNIAAAWRAVSILQQEFPVDRQDIERGIATVRSKFGNPGRFERLHPDLDWYFDGAHNLEAVRAMKREIAMKTPVNQAMLVLSLMRDKINEALVKEFLEFKKIYYYTLNTRRAAGMDELAEWIPEITPFPTENSRQKELFKELESELVIFAGSFYFYPTVRKWLQPAAFAQ